MSSDIKIVIATGDGREDALMQRLVALAEEEGVRLIPAGVAETWGALRAVIGPECVVVISRLLPEVAGGPPVPSERFAQLLNGLARSLPAGSRIVLLVGPRDDDGQLVVDAAIASGVYDIVLARETGKIATQDIVQRILRPAAYRDVADLQRSIPVASPAVADDDAGGSGSRRLHLPLPRLSRAKDPQRADQSAGVRPPAGIVVAVLGASGGVGRTTAAANLAVAWSAMGQRVSALDLCHGAPALADHLGLRSYAPGRWEALARGEPPAVVLVPGGVEGVRVLPGPTLAEREALMTVSADAVARLIQQLRLDDDYIVLDCPADPLDAFTQLAAATAAVVVFVTDASPVATKRLALAITGPWRNTSGLRCVVATRVDPSPNASRQDTNFVTGRDAEAVARDLGLKAINLALGNRPNMYWPSAAGQPVAASETEEGRAWRRLAEAIDNRLNSGTPRPVAGRAAH